MRPAEQMIASSFVNPAIWGAPSKGALAMRSTIFVRPSSRRLADSVQEEAMNELQRQDLVDLSRVVPVSLEVPVYDPFERVAIDIRPGESAGIQQHLADVAGQRVAVPQPEMVELVPPEKEAFDVQARKRAVDPGQPLRHAVVVGIVRLEFELAQTSRGGGPQPSPTRAQTAIGPDPAKGRI